MRSISAIMLVILFITSINVAFGQKEEVVYPTIIRIHNTTYEHEIRYKAERWTGGQYMDIDYADTTYSTPSLRYLKSGYYRFTFYFDNMEPTIEQYISSASKNLVTYHAPQMTYVKFDTDYDGFCEIIPKVLINGMTMNQLNRESRDAICAGHSKKDTIQIQVSHPAYRDTSVTFDLSKKNREIRLEKKFATLTVINPLRTKIESQYGHGSNDSLTFQIPTYSNFKVSAKKKGYHDNNTSIMNFVRNDTMYVDMTPQTHRVTFKADNWWMGREYEVNVSNNDWWTSTTLYTPDTLNLETGTYKVRAWDDDNDLKEKVVYVNEDCEISFNFHNVHIPKPGMPDLPDVNWTKAGKYALATAGTATIIYCGYKAWDHNGCPAPNPTMTKHDWEQTGYTALGTVGILGGGYLTYKIFKNYKVGLQFPLRSPITAEKKSNEDNGDNN